MARKTFTADFRRFFLQGLRALGPTLITLAIIYYVLNFLWRSLGWYVIQAIKYGWVFALDRGWVDRTSYGYIERYWAEENWYTPVVGVVLALLIIYIVGLFVGNLIGQGLYRLGEKLVLRIPVVKQIYPAVKQVIDMFLADPSDKKAAGQFAGSRVVAVRYREVDLWSIGLVTGTGLSAFDKVAHEDAGADHMVTVFIPSSPTAFSGYVVVVPRHAVRELPMTVNEAMQLLVSGGVVQHSSETSQRAAAASTQSAKASAIAATTAPAADPVEPAPTKGAGV
ncbi:MAG: DUF502 domain-containing protein [Planctomycetota bacterium]